MVWCQQCGRFMRVERDGWESAPSGLQVYVRVHVCDCGWRQQEFNPNDVETGPFPVTR